MGRDDVVRGLREKKLIQVSTEPPTAYQYVLITSILLLLICNVLEHQKNYRASFK